MSAHSVPVTRDIWEASVSSCCWWYTPLDEGWDAACAAGFCPADDPELVGILQMEHELDEVPAWAEIIVERVFRDFPSCGHYMFPYWLLNAVNAIGAEEEPERTMACFAVDAVRKRQAQDYVFCLDAWLAGATPEAVAAELHHRAERPLDWGQVAADVWEVLGQPTRVKRLLVERLVIMVRSAVKFDTWSEDDPEFGTDQFLGRRDEHDPRAEAIEKRLEDIWPQWPEYRAWFTEEWWLCAPKAFRLLEYRIWAIGEDAFDGSAGTAPGFLQCEDTYIDQDQAGMWWEKFTAALDAWWRGRQSQDALYADLARRLGTPDRVKRWLVRLFARRIRMLADTGAALGRLVQPGPRTRRGTKPLTFIGITR